MKSRQDKSDIKGNSNNLSRVDTIMERKVILINQLFSGKITVPVIKEDIPTIKMIILGAKSLARESLQAVLEKSPSEIKKEIHLNKKEVVAQKEKELAQAMYAGELFLQLIEKLEFAKETSDIKVNDIPESGEVSLKETKEWIGDLIDQDYKIIPDDEEKTTKLKEIKQIVEDLFSGKLTYPIDKDILPYVHTLIEEQVFTTGISIKQENLQIEKQETKETITQRLSKEEQYLTVFDICVNNYVQGHMRESTQGKEKLHTEEAQRILIAILHKNLEYNKDNQTEIARFDRLAQ